MTVTTTNSQISYSGDGTTVSFPFPYYFLASSDIQVFINGVLQTSGYTVAGAGSPLGGAVTFVSPPVAAAQVILLRNPDTLQQTAFPPNDPFPSAANERALDKLTMLCQLLVNKFTKTIGFPIYETFSGVLASASQRASTLLGFDASGNLLYLPQTASIGAGDMRVDTFTAGVDFVAGTTTQLTLSRAPGNTANLEIFFDGFFQGPDQWGVNGAVVTFNTPIPGGINKVFARTGTTLSTLTPAIGSVGSGQLVAGAVGDTQLSWGAILNRVVDSVSALAALNPGIYTRAFGTGYSAPGDGGGGPYYYSASTAQSNANGGTIIASTYPGATGCWLLQYQSTVTVKQFGAKGDGTTDDTARLQAARDWLAGLTRQVKLIFPQGIYLFSASPNWAINHAKIIPDGEVRLRYTGAAGNAVVLDAGSGSQNIYDVTFGNPGNPFIIESNTLPVNPCFVRAVHHSNICIKPRCGGANSGGLVVNFAVCTSFYVTCSVNEDGGWYGGSAAQPTYGIYLSRRNVGEAVSYCNFYNPIIEGPVKGIFLDYADGNSFFSGTSEACTDTGVYLTSNSHGNVFHKMDFEVNTNADIDDSGLLNIFERCDSSRYIYLRGNDALINGGVHENITITATATRARLRDLRYNASGTGGVISDSGVSTNWRGVVNYGTGATVGPKPITGVPIGSSPTTYTNNTDGEVDVSAQGGTITTITLTRGATTATIASNPGSAWCRTSPGDVVSINWSVAPSAVYAIPR